MHFSWTFEAGQTVLDAASLDAMLCVAPVVYERGGLVIASGLTVVNEVWFENEFMSLSI